MQEAGYDEATQALIENVMMGKNLPDPRDVRKYDLIGTLGMVDFKKLQVRQSRGWGVLRCCVVISFCIIPALDDAEALLGKNRLRHHVLQAVCMIQTLDDAEALLAKLWCRSTAPHVEASADAGVPRPLLLLTGCVHDPDAGCCGGAVPGQTWISLRKSKCGLSCPAGCVHKPNAR
jgi:hypothetical protein